MGVEEDSKTLIIFRLSNKAALRVFFNLVPILACKFGSFGKARHSEFYQIFSWVPMQYFKNSDLAL